MNISVLAIALAVAATMMTLPCPGSATELVQLSVKDHRFTPNEITVPAGEKFRMEVTNQDEAPEEIESHDLKIEKIVTGGGKISLVAGPLQPGSYKVFGDYHPDSAVATVHVVDKD